MCWEGQRALVGFCVRSWLGIGSLRCCLCWTICTKHVARAPCGLPAGSRWKASSGHSFLRGARILEKVFPITVCFPPHLTLALSSFSHDQFGRCSHPKGLLDKASFLTSDVPCFLVPAVGDMDELRMDEVMAPCNRIGKQYLGLQLELHPSSVWTQSCYCLPCSYQEFGPWERAYQWLLWNLKNADKVLSARSHGMWMSREASFAVLVGLYLLTYLFLQGLDKTRLPLWNVFFQASTCPFRDCICKGPDEEFHMALFTFAVG